MMKWILGLLMFMLNVMVVIMIMLFLCRNWDWLVVCIFVGRFV